MANVAAVDCGTFSTRLLVCGPGGEPLVRLMKVTALGEGVDRSRSLAAPAMDRALTALRDYRRVMDDLDVRRARMVGTSALRDAGNRDLFCEEAARAIGTELELLSGQDEAALSFSGATRELPAETGPWLVADIGGGSTELVVGPRPAGACSLDLGCVRVTERFLHHDPPTPAELGAATGADGVEGAEGESGEGGLPACFGLAGETGDQVVDLGGPGRVLDLGAVPAGGGGRPGPERGPYAGRAGRYGRRLGLLRPGAEHLRPCRRAPLPPGPPGR